MPNPYPVVKNKNKNSESRVEDQVSDLSTIQLEITNLITEMANPNTVNNVPTANSSINYALLKLFADTIPVYNGDSNTLEIFVNSCDQFINSYVNRDATLDTYLLRVVIGKLTGRAQILIGCRTELNNWQLIKNALRANFGDQRDLDCLVQDLLALQPHKNENPYEFGKRIQLVRSQIASRINSLAENVMDMRSKILNLNNYDNLSLKTFIRGLRGNLQTTIRLRNPVTLEQAMSYVVEEENFYYAQARSNQFAQGKPQHSKPNFSNSNFSHKPMQFNHTPVRQFENINPRPPQFNNFHNNSQPQFNNNYHRQVPFGELNPRFPKPIPIKQHFPTNSQVFGPPKNVFKPDPNRVKDLPKPTPMSTTSYNPTIRRPPFQNNYNQNQNPKFAFEELFNIEDESHNYTDDHYYPHDNFNCNYEYPTTSGTQPPNHNYPDTEADSGRDHQNFRSHTPTEITT